MSLIANRDNYDLESNSTAARLFNPLIAAWTDPSASVDNGKVFGGLGHKVNIQYVNASSVPVTSNYIAADYNNDRDYLRRTTIA